MLTPSTETLLVFAVEIWGQFDCQDSKLLVFAW